MKVVFEGDRNGLEVQVKLNWRSLTAVLKALLPVVTALLSLLLAPEVARLGATLGWW